MIESCAGVMAEISWERMRACIDSREASGGENCRNGHATVAVAISN